MAAYIDENFYNNVYMGNPIPSADFARVALRASEDVNAMTYGRIERHGFGNFSASIQTQIKMATSALAEARYAYFKLTAGSGGALKTSESVPDYSYTIDKESIQKINFEAYGRARSYLYPTNLLYAGMCPCK
ncbi:MAG: hypothetical protein LBD46_04820 [Endomicrobium sp.]|jgi:hypothetical protein|nr:hypothetical protein [Endomicrobium sp.]